MHATLYAAVTRKVEWMNRPPDATVEATVPVTADGPPNPSLAQLCYMLGPGLITGASDDDPSGIATYSQVGAQFGFAMLWTMFFSYPLMAAIQEISARIGRVSGIGIAGNIRRHYPRPCLLGIVSLLLIANIFNIGADIGEMAADAGLIIPGPPALFVIVAGSVSLL